MYTHQSINKNKFKTKWETVDASAERRALRTK